MFAAETLRRDSGKHATDTEAKKLHGKLKPNIVQQLGRGGQGEVVQLKYTHKNRPVVLARKRLKGLVDSLREEANILERLCHDHIVKLVGTYSYHSRALYLILWPAATCNLAELLGDLNNLRFDEEDREDILERLAQMELVDTSVLDNTHAVSAFHDFHNDGCPLNYLRRILGCLTAAVHYCHTSRIRHLDLKPENILVSPGRVYLADFGISRDVNNEEHTMTCLEIGTKSWCAPERDPNFAEALPAPPLAARPATDHQDGWSMKAADVYSLGLVFLNIAAILYGARQSKLHDILKPKDWRLKSRQLDEYMSDLRVLALVTQVFADESGHTCAPKHIVGLIKSMVVLKASDRPNMAKINEELVSLGGIEQVYHNSCCKAPARTLTQLMDKKHAQVFDERARLEQENIELRKELQVLRAAKETIESRLQHQKEKHDKDWKTLVRQLEDEKELRQQLEAGQSRPEHFRRQRPGMTPPGRACARKPPRAPSQQQQGKPAVSVTSPAQPRSVSPKPTQRPGSDMRKSTESLTNFMLHTQASWSRVRASVKPSTPTRSGTPITPNTQESTLTNTTDSSMTSSILSRGSRRSVSTRVSPDPSPNASRILSEDQKATTTEASIRSSYFQGSAWQNGNPTATTPRADSVHDVLSERGTAPDTVSQQGTEYSDLPDITRVPSLPMAKSWAAVAGDPHGLQVMIGFADAAGKKKKKKA